MKTKQDTKFNLREKRGEWNCKTGWEQTESFGGAMKFYREEDVKEFIRLLKEEIIKKSTGGRVRSGGNMIGHGRVLEIIDKLTGEKLSQPKEEE